MDFPEFGKIARLNRNCTVTEKIDGTNALVAIEAFPHVLPLDCPPAGNPLVLDQWFEDGERMTWWQMRAGSRMRWITPQDDNYGFARWVQQNAEELRQLGPGLHYGEWWGSGIQRGYGLPRGEKRFSLFNVGQWGVYPTVEGESWIDPAPACCSVVPILYQGPFRTDLVDEVLDHLRSTGSHAAPGFERPEGVIVWHEAARCYFKATLEKDEEPKTKFKPAHPGQTKGQAGQSAAKPGAVTAEHLHKLGKVLDAQPVPQEGRMLHDGETLHCVDVLR